MSAYTPPLSPRVSELSTRVDMCDVFAQRNTNRTQAQQMATWPKTIARAVEKGVKEGGMSISNVWGSNWIGQVPFEQHMLMFDRMYRMWEEAGIPVTRVGMADATGWSRAGISGAMTFVFLAMGVGGFVWGTLSDRFGARPVVLAASILLVLGLALASRASSLLGFQLAYGLLVGFGWPWWAGLAVTAAAFVYEHAIVRPSDLSRVNRAFFTANGFVGIALFAFAVVDLVLRLHLRP